MDVRSVGNEPAMNKPRISFDSMRSFRASKGSLAIYKPGVGALELGSFRKIVPAASHEIGFVS